MMKPLKDIEGEFVYALKIYDYDGRCAIVNSTGYSEAIETASYLCRVTYAIRVEVFVPKENRMIAIYYGTRFGSGL